MLALDALEAQAEQLQSRVYVLENMRPENYIETLEDAEAERDLLAARVSELEATRPEARYAAAMRVVALIRLAHDRHLATGDYITLGIAAQDALSEFDRAVLAAREEQK